MDNDEIRSTLEEERERRLHMRDDLRSGDDLDSEQRFSSGGELSSADQHPADAASEQVQREVSLSMLEQIESELADVEHALARLDDGTYGTCEACGKEIDEERLSAIPTARFCVDDQARAENEVDLRSTVNSPSADTQANTPL